MKKLVKNCFFTVLMVAVLVTAALVTSCDGVFDGKIFQGPEEDSFVPYDPPANMGYIRIKLTNNARNTFTPDKPASLLDLYYYVEVRNGSNVLIESIGTASVPVKLPTVTNRAILIAPGTYTVNVYASTANNNTTVIGFGTKSSVVVAPGTGGSVTVNLEPTYDSGNGTFAWDITLPSNFPLTNTTAVLNLFEYGTTNKVTLILPSTEDVDLTNISNLTSTVVSIPAGFYTVQIAMISSGSPPLFQNRTVTHIVHIGKNMTTTFDTTSAPLLDLNNYAYNVIFDHNDITGDPTTSATTLRGPYAHGTTFVRLSPDPVNAEDSSLVINGWYKTRASANIADSDYAWNFASNKIINNLTLYAGWSAKANLGLTITFVDAQTDPDITVTVGTDTFSQTNYVSGAVLESVTAELTLDTGFTVTSWHCQEIPSWTNSDGNTSDSVTLTNSDTGLFQYLAVGTYTFEVGLMYNGTKPFNVHFTITITP